MLYYFLYSLKDLFFGFNVFRYITFRAAMAAFTAFVISIALGPLVIKGLKKLNIGQNVRKEETPTLYPLHKDKEGTPTMGGILIICAIVFSTLMWADIKNKLILISIIAVVWLGLVGFVDDYIKLVMKRSKGLGAFTKLTGQIILGLGIGIYLFLDPSIKTNLDIPFMKKLFVDLGIIYIPFVMLVIVGTSNAVNLTDGLDGLAIGSVTIIALTYGAFSYMTGNIKFGEYLNIIYIPGSGELAVFCAAMLGAGLGFLWFNSHPASIFMGDTGSLALGGAVGVVSVLIKKELLLLIVGGIFVAEALSVIIQVASFRLGGKRVFLMSPLHHHYQLKGWSESKIIIRFWIVAIILALISLSTLKLR